MRRAARERQAGAARHLLLGLACCLPLAACSEFWRWGGDGRHTAAPRVHAAPQEPARGEGAQQYTVKRGDTLYSIATRHRLDYHQVAAWNGIGADFHIDVGQVLRLSAPGAPQRSAQRAVPQRRAKADTDAAPVAAAPAAVTLAPKAAGEPAVALERYYQWQWPLRGAIAKTYAPEGGSKGVDIGGDLGQTVIAAAPGRVVYSGSGLKGYGELVIIKHDETYLSAYGYNRKRLVEEGALVTAGQAIAELGMGPSRQPMLHFEIREHGRPMDPLPLLPRLEK